MNWFFGLATFQDISKQIAQCRLICIKSGYSFEKKKRVGVGGGGEGRNNSSHNSFTVSLRADACFR